MHHPSACPARWALPILHNHVAAESAKHRARIRAHPRTTSRRRVCYRKRVAQTAPRTAGRCGARVAFLVYVYVIAVIMRRREYICVQSKDTACRVCDHYESAVERQERRFACVSVRMHARACSERVLCVSDACTKSPKT